MSNQISARRTGPTTLHDVARRAGVSAMTVSRVLSNKKRVTDETRATVLRAVEELEYRPNLAARSMRQNKSRQIGVLVQNNPQIRHTHPLAYEFLLGINEGLDDAGYMMSLIRLTDVANDAGLGAKALEGHLVDGLIVVNQIPDATAARLDGMAPPCVWLDSNVWRPERCLRRDEIGAGTLVVEKLVELGYRELILAHPVPDRNHYSFTQRIEGVRQASRRADLELRTVSIEANNFQPLWPQLTPDVAVIFPDIYMARKFGFFMAEMQLAAGRDCAVACCDDDIQVGAQVWGGLTRVSFDRFEMGRQAAQMMLEVLPDLDAPCPSRLIKGDWIAGRTAPRAPLN